MEKKEEKKKKHRKKIRRHPYSSVGKESACNAETLVRFLGWEDLLEKG